MIITKFPKGLPLAECSKFLLEHYPITDICDTCAQLLLSQTNKITVTRQQLMEHFKIIGEREDGTEERRGRKSLAERLAAAKRDRTERVKMIDNSKDTGED